MSPELILTIGLLIVIALPGLLLGLADRLGSTEIRHISRDHITHQTGCEIGSCTYSGQPR